MRPAPRRLLDVVTPSFPKHANHYGLQLDTWVRFCADVSTAVSFRVIVSAEDCLRIKMDVGLSDDAYERLRGLLRFL